MSPAVPTPEGLLGHTIPVMVAVLIVAGIVALARTSPALNRLVRAGGSVSSVMIPRLLALTTFTAGVILLFSGATPSHEGRMRLVEDLIPLPIVEISAYFESIAGVALVLLARGLQRRLDAAWHLTLWVLGTGIVFAIASALDIEQAIFLAFMFVALLSSRRYFHRRSSLFEERFTRGWFVAIIGVLAATGVLFYLAYGHRVQAGEVFWRFEDDAQAPRAARGLTLAVVVLIVLSLMRLLRPTPRRLARTAPDIESVTSIVRASPRANAHLALLGDKEILLDESKRAFLMIGAAGDSRVAMGDPVGPIAAATAVVETFIRQCDHDGTWPVFYRVGPQLLYLYLEYGLAVVKLGEVARVPLTGFSMDGPERRNLRRVWRKLVDAGCTFELVPAGEAGPLLPELHRVSSEWLASKQAREKSFSLGRWSESFIAHSPVAVVRIGERIVAFGTLWLSGQNGEVEIDLMRHVNDAPPGIMRYLITESMVWAAREGYREFNLGMVPLSGIRTGTVAPLWNQLAGAVRAGGERYYNFQGLREFKAWFHPEWEPSYLVSPGGAKRPIIVAHIAALIAGGSRGLVSR